MAEELTVTVNSSEVTLSVDPRLLLSDVLRNELGLTGTKRGCDSARCGACTVLLNGDPVKSCNLLALQTDGDRITTVEGLGEDGGLTALQRSFWEEFSFQCGFCTPGMLMTSTALLREHPDPSEDEIREYIAGNLCRCTGYVNIVSGIKETARTSEGENP